MTHRRLSAVLVVFVCLSSCDASLFRRSSHIKSISRLASSSRQGAASTPAAQTAADQAAQLRLFESEPAGVEVAARQPLFDYGVSVALGFLQQKLQGQSVPDVSKTFSIPIVGSFELQLTDIVVASFASSVNNSDLTILGDGFFHLVASDIAANLTFKWHWTKAGLSGSGDGELLLQGGTIDWVFDVRKDEALQKPQLQVVTANSNFDSVDLKIHSYSADWLYQAVLTLFNEAVKRQVQNGVTAALDSDVPAHLNAVLASLPTRIQVRGLPFSTAFDYSIYTAGFVLLKGYGEVEVPAADAAADAATATTATDAVAGTSSAAGASRRSLSQAADPALSATAAATSSASTTGSSSSMATSALALAQMEACPFETSPLPLAPEAIGTDAAMLSIYVHEATANCLLWGLYRSGKLAFSLRDGTVPGLSITTDLLALLVPQLPTLYPHMHMVINVEALSTPTLSFSAERGTTINAAYRMALVVANETLGNPEVVRLSANLTLSGAFDWDSTAVTDVSVHHTVEASALSVPAEQWDNTVVWLVQNYAGLASLRQLVQLAVRTPVASLVDLSAAQAATWDGWYGMSADVEVRLPAAK